MQEALPPVTTLRWEIDNLKEVPHEILDALRATGKWLWVDPKHRDVFGTHLSTEEFLSVIRTFYPRATVTYSLYHREYGRVVLRKKTFFETLRGDP